MRSTRLRLRMLSTAVHIVGSGSVDADSVDADSGAVTFTVALLTVAAGAP